MISQIVKKGHGVFAGEEEIEIAKLLAEDLSIMEIAGRLKVKRKAVETKLEKMRRKFDCHSSKGILVLFFRNKLIE